MKLDNYTKVPIKYSDESISLVENIWCIKKGKYLEVANIPFYVTGYALKDLIELREDDLGVLTSKLIKGSGNSTIQIKDYVDVNSLRKKLKEMGCDSEWNRQQAIIAVNVPSNVNYTTIKKFLDIGETLDKWRYREACLGWL